MTSNAPLILLVEDERVMKKLIIYNLERAGYAVHAVSNGVEALSFCDHHKPDLIVSDVKMPVMGGLELCNTLQKDPSTRDIPFMFLSASAQEHEILQGLEQGGDIYLTKPVEPGVLLDEVKRFLDRPRSGSFLNH